VLGTSGGLAGAIAKTAIAPLERLRLLAQTGQASSGVVHTMRKVIHNEGVAALWRGNTVNVIRMVPNKCVLLACSDLYQDAFRSPQISSFTRGGLAGALAGMTACCCTYPLDLVRTRMAGFLLAPGGATRYETMLGTMLIIGREEGVGALFRGVTPTLIGAFPYEGIKFGCYASLKRHCGDERPTAAWKAAFGALSATVAHLITYPNDTLRRRLQLQGAPGSPILYRGYVDCFSKVVRLEGWAALYRGLTLTIVRGVPNTGIQFGLYELCKELLVFLELLQL